MANEGHKLVNHTWDNHSFTGVSTGAPPPSAAERAEELGRTEELLRQRTGTSTLPYFRSPFGDIDASVNSDAGYRYTLLWTIDTRGWDGATIDEIVARVRGGVVPGAIVGMHVDRASQDGPALQAVVDAPRAEGYTFGTVPGILGS